MPVYSCENFDNFEIVFIHDSRSKYEADNAMQNLKNCQKSINMKTGQFRVFVIQDFKNNRLESDLNKELSLIKEQT